MFSGSRRIRASASWRILCCCVLLPPAAQAVWADGILIEKVEPSQGFVDEDTDVALTGEEFDLEATAALLAGGPFLVGIYNTGGYAYGVAVAGDYAYVADRESGLQVIDVSNPQSPILEGRCDTLIVALVIDVSAEDKYRYEYGGEISFVENLRAVCEELQTEHPEIRLHCSE